VKTGFFAKKFRGEFTDSLSVQSELSPPNDSEKKCPPAN